MHPDGPLLERRDWLLVAGIACFVLSDLILILILAGVLPE